MQSARDNFFERVMTMQELHSFLDLLAMLAAEPRNGVLLILLIVAGVIDYRTYRIPNWLTFSGVVFALLYSTLGSNVHQGFLWSLGGLGLGLLIMLPMYALRVMGAGDVKLMAMVGTFLGYTGTPLAILCTFIAGGIAALGFALCRGVFGRMLSNIKEIASTAAFSVFGGMQPNLHVGADTSVGKLPYGVSIAVGTIGYVFANQLGYF
jgi:prepilin peptidase CpaA